MGFELERFSSRIKTDFCCSICKMVLDDPKVTPCGHFFCNACIKDWLQIAKLCPVDRTPLSFDTIISPTSIFSSLLGKLALTCEFRWRGCRAVVRLDNVKRHLAVCDYRTASEIDKDDLIDVPYDAAQGFMDEMKELREQMKTLDLELMNQKTQFSSIANEERELIAEMTNLLAAINELIKTFNCHDYGLGRQREMVSDNSRLKWRKIINIKFSNEEPNILEINDNSKVALAQSLYPLGPTLPSEDIYSLFRIKIISGASNIVIGLTSRDVMHTIANILGTVNNTEIFHLYEYCYRSGDLVESGMEKDWQCNDIIEIGIRYPKKDDNLDVNEHTFESQPEVYFLKNGCLVTEYKSTVTITTNLYPTITLINGDAKVKYLNN